MEELVLNIFFILLECLKIGIVSCLVLGGAYKKGKRSHLISLIIIMFVCNIDYCFRDNSDMWIWRDILVLAISFGLSKEKLKNRIFRFVCAYCIVNIIDSMMGVFVSYLILGSKGRIDETVLGNIGINSGTLIIYILMGYFISRKTNRSEKTKNDVTLKQILLIVVDLFCCLFVVGGMQVVLSEGVNIRIKMLLIISIMGLCIILIVQSIVQNVLYNSRNYFKEMLENKEKYMKTKYHYYERQQSNYEEMEKFRHDVNKHFRYLYELSKINQNEEMEKYICQIQNSMKRSSKMIDCGNMMVSAIVSDISCQAREYNIKFCCNGHLPQQLKVGEMDLCILLGNVLENAVESCLRSQQESSFIQVVFSQNDSNIVIAVKNTMVGRNIKKGGHLATTKKMGKHGIGMSNVAEVVEKYGGELLWEAENNIFTTEIFI